LGLAQRCVGTGPPEAVWFFCLRRRPMLSVHDFLNLSAALLLLLVEWLFRSVARVLYIALPAPLLLQWERCMEKVLRLAAGDSEPYDERRDYDAGRLIRDHGYPVEEYTVETRDGYLITIHRIPYGRDANGSKEKKRLPVLIMHGFLECSEVWLPRGPKKSLPYVLADAGYEVWLGNVRGNRYGCKHVSLNTRSYDFWKFGMDEMIRFDLPAIIGRMLKTSKSERYAYIGFSQGTGIGFGLFSTNPELAERATIFIALAPAARVNGVKLTLVDTLMRCDPNIIYLMFGRRRLLGMTIFWRALLPQKTYVKLIDICTWYLFGWEMRNINEKEKSVLYGHLYSLGSVRTMVHWFQTIARGRFQMYDDEASKAANKRYPSHIPPEYPIRQIKVPTALFYGGSDTLCDMPWLLDQLKDTPLRSFCIDEYEHLDFQFSSSAHTKVYPMVTKLIQNSVKSSGLVSKSELGN